MLSIIKRGNILLMLVHLLCIVCDTIQVVDMCFTHCSSFIVQAIMTTCEKRVR